MINKNSETKQRFSIKKYSFGITSALVGVFFAAGANYAQAQIAPTPAQETPAVTVAQSVPPVAPIVTPAPVIQTLVVQPATQVETTLAPVAQTTTQATSVPVARTTTQAENAPTSVDKTTIQEPNTDTIIAKTTPAQAKADITTEEKTKAEVRKAQVKVTPKWTANTTESIVVEIKRQEKEEVKEYVVQWGDTLNRISKATGTSVADLVRFNNIKQPNKIFVGDLLKNVLYVTPSNLDPRNQVDPRNRAQQNGRRSWIANTVEEIRNEIDNQTQVNNLNYVIRWGDTLSRISKVSGKSIQELTDLNKITNINKIYAGEELKGVLVVDLLKNITDFSSENLQKIKETLESRDTDKDGLNDFVERLVTFTNPNDSTSNDALLDIDDDGLTINEELNVYKTNPAFHDSDFDLLNDGDEIKIYKTSPINNDTDGDGARDGWEIKNGTNPLIKQERFTVEETATIANGMQVKVSSSVLGDQVETLSIPKEEHLLLTKEIPGLIGAPISLTAKNNVDNAALSIQFDKNLLPKDHDLSIYYFNEDTQLLEELETTIEGNKAKANLNHFSYYVLINKKDYLDTTSNTYTIRRSDKTPGNKLNINFSIDTSKSMSKNDPGNYRGQLIKNIIDGLDSNDKVAIIDFDGSHKVLYPLGSDFKLANSKLNKLDKQGSTRLDIAVEKGIKQVAKTSGQKVVILLTDGKIDNKGLSREKQISNIKKLLEKKENKDITFYTVGLGRDVDIRLLRDIATLTGGKYYAVKNTVEMKNTLADLKKEISSINLGIKQDTNKDGIPNYYTSLIYTGKLKVGTGINLFKPLIDDFKKKYPKAPLDESSSLLFEEHFGKNNGDYDADGIKNGEEIIIVVNKSDKAYIKIKTNPIVNSNEDRDGDGFIDEIEAGGKFIFENDIIGWNFGKPNINRWNVGPRDLAFFATLAYGVNNKFTQDDKYKKFLDEVKYLKKYWTDITHKFTGTEVRTKFKQLFNVHVYERNNTNQIILAFRGTDEGLPELLEDVTILFGTNPQSVLARQFISENLMRLAGKEIYITGHSLGGHLAYEAAHKLVTVNKDLLKGLVNFSGPGIGGLSPNKKLDALRNSQVQMKTIIPKDPLTLNDIIVHGGKHPYKPVEIERVDLGFWSNLFSGSHEMIHFLEKIKQGYRGIESRIKNILKKI